MNLILVRSQNIAQKIIPEVPDFASEKYAERVGTPLLRLLKFFSSRINLFENLDVQFKSKLVFLLFSTKLCLVLRYSNSFQICFSGLQHVVKTTVLIFFRIPEENLCKQ